MLTQHFKMLIILKCWISNINANRELEITFGFQHHHPLLRQSWKSPKHARQEAINPRVVFDDLHGRASFCSVQPADLRTSWVEKTTLETQTYGHNTDLNTPNRPPDKRPTTPDKIVKRSDNAKSRCSVSLSAKPSPQRLFALSDRSTSPPTFNRV